MLKLEGENLKQGFILVKMLLLQSKQEMMKTN